MIFKIAWKNVISAGLRTWLNTFIISLTIAVIILLQGLYSGLLKEVATNRINQELGRGQYWHKNYDPYDPLSLKDAHGMIPPAMETAIKKREAIPILMVAGSVYPQGRIFPAVLKGIPPNQHILDLPFEKLNRPVPKGVIPAMIGKHMARQTRLKINDMITVRWRNSRGAFNATDLMIVDIFDSKVPAMDQGQVWLRWSDLENMNLSPNQATIIVSAEPVTDASRQPEWIAKTLDNLLSDTYQLVKSKSIGGSIFYVILLFLTLIAIFDTQALSIFKRRKEIGTLMALGMTNRSIVGTFTLEGSLHGVFAAIATMIYGIPLFWYLQKTGFTFPISSDQYGIAMSNHLHPVYSPELVIGTLVFVMVLITIISYLPARKITKLQPYVALRGKWS